jgi:hypothetical protein
MSNYKKVDADQLDSDLTAVADKIREKTGVTDELAFPDGFVDALDGGASLETCMVTIRRTAGVPPIIGTTVKDGVETPLWIQNEMVNEMLVSGWASDDTVITSEEVRFPALKGSFLYFTTDGDVDYAAGGIVTSGDIEYIDFLYNYIGWSYVHIFKINGDCEIEIM